MARQRGIGIDGLQIKVGRQEQAARHCQPAEKKPEPVSVLLQIRRSSGAQHVLAPLCDPKRSSIHGR